MHSLAKETKEPDSLANLFDFLKEKDSGLRNRTVIYWPAIIEGDVAQNHQNEDLQILEIVIDRSHATASQIG